MLELLGFLGETFSNFVNFLNSFYFVSDFSILDLIIIIFFFNIIMKFILIK